MKKKSIGLFIVGLLIAVGSVSAGVTINYILNKTVNQSVQVGNTVLVSDGLNVELSDYDPYTLTYYEIEETDTQKHTLTYTYTYEVLVEGKNIEVSSVTDDIVVTAFEANDTTITITFSLNQEKTFNDGDMLNIQFYFEAVDVNLVGYTALNPININTATKQELINIGFTDTEAQQIVTYAEITHIDSLSHLVGVIGDNSITTRYNEWVDAGIVVFN